MLKKLKSDIKSILGKTHYFKLNMKIKNAPYFGKLLHAKGFKIWFLYMFFQIEGRRFIVEGLHKGLFEVFQDIYDLVSNRDNINVPPRSGKTTLAKYFIAYALAVNPKCNFIYTSFSQELLAGISSELAGILQHPIYRAMYGSNAVEEKFEADPLDQFWADYAKEAHGVAKYTARKIITEQGGIVLFASIGSAITGFGAGIRGGAGFTGMLGIDDANKPADIRSQTMRDKVKTYYEETLLSRLNGGEIPIANIQQRLHLEDLSGFLRKVYGFKTLKRSLIIDGVCQLPSQYSEKRLLEVQKNEFMFMAQYQQEPIMEGGNLFKLETIRQLGAENMPEKYLWRFITADLAYKSKDANDYQVFAYWGVKKETIGDRERDHLYLIDVKRKKLNSVDVENWVEGWISEKINYGFRYIWIEDKSHGIYLNQLYRKKGWPVPDEDALKDMLPREVDKVTRANNIIPCLDSAAPNLTFNIDIENYSELLEEVLAFDNAKHDDFVDNLIDAIKIGLFTNDTVSEWDQLLG